MVSDMWLLLKVVMIYLGWEFKIVHVQVDLRESCSKSDVQLRNHILYPRLLFSLRSKPTPRAPTIELKHISSHMCRTQRADKQNQASEILRLPNPARRLSSDQRFHRFPKSVLCHSTWEDTRANNVDGDVVWHEFAGQHFGEMDAGSFAWAVGEGAVSRSGETTFRACRYVNSLDPGHRGNVDDSAWMVGRGSLFEKCIQTCGDVEDRFDVQGINLVPTFFRKVVVRCSPVRNIRILFGRSSVQIRLL